MLETIASLWRRAADRWWQRGNLRHQVSGRLLDATNIPVADAAHGVARVVLAQCRAQRALRLGTRLRRRHIASRQEFRRSSQVLTGIEGIRDRDAKRW